jgi:hypothetical protein
MSHEERSALKGLLGLHAFGVLWIDNPDGIAPRKEVSMRLNPIMLKSYNQGTAAFNRMAAKIKNQFPPDVCKRIDGMDVFELKSYCNDMPRPAWARDDA